MIAFVAKLPGPVLTLLMLVSALFGGFFAFAAFAGVLIGFLDAFVSGNSASDELGEALGVGIMAAFFGVVFFVVMQARSYRSRR